MNVSDPFKHYTETVCEQIRWKKAHAAVTKELTDHLLDQKEAYIACGDSEALAEEKALQQMGDPVEVGAALDGMHKPAPQWGMLGLVLLLFGIGVFLQLQLAPLLAEDWLQELFTARLYVLPFFAVITLLLFYHIDFSFFGKRSWLLPLLLFVSIILKEVFGLQVNGQRWFLLGNLAISPMLLCLFFPLGFSCILYRFRRQGLYGYLKACSLAVCIAMILFGWFSTACLVVFTFAAAILLFTAAFRNWFGTKTKPVFFILAIAGLLAAVYLLFSAPYRFSRIAYTLHPEEDPYGFGYIALLLRNMLADSKFFGSAKSALVPPQLTDDFCAEYFLTFITYRFGWLVSIGLVLLLAAFLVWGFRKCLKQKSILGQMVSLSILSVFTAECFFYILANLGYPFISSACLPFLSYGMNSTLIHMALTGILLSVFRTGDAQLDIIHISKGKENRFIQWADGTLMIHSK